MNFFSKLTEETFSKNKVRLPVDPPNGLVFRVIDKQDCIILVGSSYSKIDKESYQLLIEDDLDILFFETSEYKFIETNFLNKKFLRKDNYSSWWIKVENSLLELSLIPKAGFTPIGSLGSYTNLIKISELSPVLNTIFPIRHIECSDEVLSIEITTHNYYFDLFKNIFLHGVNFINPNHFQKFAELIDGVILFNRISAMRSFWIYLAESNIFDIKEKL